MAAPLTGIASRLRHRSFMSPHSQARFSPVTTELSRIEGSSASGFPALPCGRSQFSPPCSNPRNASPPRRGVFCWGGLWLGSLLRQRVTDFGLDDRSRDPADSRRTPRTLQLPRPRRQPGQLSDGRRIRADTPRRPASARSQCPPADALRERRADTCSLATHPSRQSEHRRSHPRARRPEGRPGSWRSGARRHPGDPPYLRAHSAPEPIAPRPLVRPASGTAVR